MSHSVVQANVKTLADIAMVAVLKRLQSPPRRSAKQTIARLGQQWESYGPRGADTIDCKVGHDLQVRFPFQFFCAWNSSSASSSTCAIIYHLARNPDVQDELQAYPDEHLGSEDRAVATATRRSSCPTSMRAY